MLRVVVLYYEVPQESVVCSGVFQCGRATRSGFSYFVCQLGLFLYGLQEVVSVWDVDESSRCLLFFPTLVLLFRTCVLSYLYIYRSLYSQGASQLGSFYFGVRYVF